MGWGGLFGQSASPGPSHVMLMEEGIDCTIDLTEREDKVRVLLVSHYMLL